MTVGTPADVGHAVVNSSATSLALTTTANILSGDLVIVWGEAGSTGAQMSAVADSGAVNVYTNIVIDSNSSTMSIAYCPNAAAVNSGGTITGTFGSASARKGITAFRVPGMALTSAVIDANITKTGTVTGTSITLGAVTVAKQQALLVAALFTSGSDPGTITFTGWTAVGGTTATSFLKPFYKIVSSFSPDTAALSWINSVTGAKAAEKVFYAADAIGPGGGNLMLLGVG